MFTHETESLAPVVYIIANCKEWNKNLLGDFKSNSEQHWVFISTEKGLLESVAEHQPRYIFFLHWNWIVSEDIWSRYECVCFHMTDVPYGRGGSPLQNLIIAGHEKTMLTAFQMVAEMDAGPVYCKKEMFLSGTAQEIYERAGKLSLEILKWIVFENPQPVEQKGEIVVFKRRKPEQSRLPESNQPVSVYDFIRMLDADGYPHAFIEYGDFRIEFCKACEDGDVTSAEVMIIPKIDRNDLSEG